MHSLPEPWQGLRGLFETRYLAKGQGSPAAALRAIIIEACIARRLAHTLQRVDMSCYQLFSIHNGMRD